MLDQYTFVMQCDSNRVLYNMNIIGNISTTFNHIVFYMFVYTHRFRKIYIAGLLLVYVFEKDANLDCINLIIDEMRYNPKRE